MMQVNIADAKKDFSRLVRLVENKKEPRIGVARNGKRVAYIVPAEETPVSKRIGVGKGRFKAPDDFDANNEEVYAMLKGGSL